ncbi:hypothetical protein N7456_001796 [Penicillium angulare]|uniref:HNH nuclease domain-containing protein n=1 Tax=Penicillium angulare TaxID=116970 RepID=A0A9W9G748_9EURO|nr:hypothetical protein N7456_001796 [Penicillium angulare]
MNITPTQLPTSYIDSNQGYCHLTGFWDKGLVKAAHLVAKSLSTDEISDLFGVEQIVLSDPRNGLSLHKNIEEGLDSGRIVIVPFPQDTGDTMTATRWKCVLTDKSQKDNMITQQSSWYWRDLDNRELTFLNDNRPARRYLYFRFIVTYIFRKKTDAESDFVQNVETKGLWATPGPYLRNSMLNVLSRNISGHELPPPILEGSTFTDEQYPPERNPSLSGSLAAHGIRRAVINSAKEREHEDDTIDSGSDEDDSCSDEDDRPAFEHDFDIL